MDTPTLLICSTLASAIMTLTMLTFYRASRREQSLLDWAIAGALNVAAYLILVLPIPTPYWVLPTTINTLFFSANLAVLSGLMRHFCRPPPFLLFTFFAAVAWSLHYHPFAQEGVRNRIYLFSFLHFFVNGYTVVLLWKNLDQHGMRRVYFLLLFIEVVYLLQLLGRSAKLLVDADLATTIKGNQFVQTIGWLSDLFFISMLTMALALIVIRKQVLALRQLIRSDKLTGWMNRHALAEIAPSEFERHRRTNHPLSFVMFDIDHFKRINDSYGHAVGDAAIQHVAQKATEQLRGYDAQFRIGGEEFLVLLPEVDSVTGFSIAERVRQSIAENPLVINTNSIAITISLGIATADENDRDWEPVLGRADEALYRSKKNGRNQVTAAESTPTIASNQLSLA